jgi:dsDNA-binding SOS-regulon protein
MLQNAVRDFNREELDIINELVNEEVKKGEDEKSKSLSLGLAEIRRLFFQKIKGNNHEKNKTIGQKKRHQHRKKIHAIEKVKIGNGSYIFNEDNMYLMRLMPDNRIDSCVRYSPYGSIVHVKKMGL